MAFRFRRSVKIAPGIRLNFGKRGVSLSAGVRGAHVTVGKRGTFANLGLPGTGLSVRERLDGPARPTRINHASASSDSFALHVNEDGTTELASLTGDRLPAPLQQQLRRDHREEICAALEQHASALNDARQAILNIHTQSPAPFSQPGERGPALPDPPVLPALRPVTLWEKIVGWFSAKARHVVATRHAEHVRLCVQIETEHAAAVEAVESAAREWRLLREGAAHLDFDASRRYLERCVRRAVAEVNTSVTAEFDHHGTAWLDAFLPGSEHLQSYEADVLTRTQQLALRPLSTTALRKDQMRFLHGVGFRIVGESFARVPAVQTVVLSVAVMANDETTGRRTRQVRYNVRVQRARWFGIDFNDLKQVDPVSCLATFDMRRNMTKTGIFRPVLPYPQKADAPPPRTRSS